METGVIFAILFTVVSVAYAHKLYIEGSFSSFTGDVVSLDFFSALILYLPNSLFAYGFIADIMTMKYHYSIASITALVGMLVNRYIAGDVVDGIIAALSFVGSQFSKLPVAAQAAVAAVGVGAAAAVAPLAAAAIPAAPAAAPAAAPLLSLSGVGLPAIGTAAAPAAAPLLSLSGVGLPAIGTAAAPAAAAAAADAGRENNPFRGGKNQKGGATNFCSLPGFEWLENKTSPQGIVMSMTVLWYLMIELWDTGNAPQSVALGATTGIVFLLQTLVLTRSGCLASYKYGSWSAVIALIMAITFAGSSYGIQKALAKRGSSAPSAPTPQGSGGFTCPPGTKLNANESLCVPVGPGLGQQIPLGDSGQQSQPVDDNDQFVCEAYKDGELVTSTIVE